MSPLPFLKRHLISIDCSTSTSKENQAQDCCRRGQRAYGSSHHSHEPRLAAPPVIFLLSFAVVELSVSFKHWSFLLCRFLFWRRATREGTGASTVPSPE